MSNATFRIAGSFRLPGLGLLVLPAPPAPDWLAGCSLHTALPLRLHRPGQPALLVVATVEELSHDGQLPARTLLLDADPGELGAGAWLETRPAEPSELW